MNVVASSGRYQIYGESLETFDHLPVATYTICFSKQSGFWLQKHIDLDPKEDAIYGKHYKRVEKILRGYEVSNRNFGVILSGKKGIGKSLLARLLAEESIKRGYPVIIADAAIPGIADFLSSIEQQIVVIFDEFEKVFAKTDGYDPQVELLSLFDGIDNGKKLFVITCNNPKDLNEYLINRPGRFHYHFEISCPTAEEVRQYMNDKLGEGFEVEIEKTIKLASITDITYDCLRAIAFDLKLGYTIEETLQDLNINYDNNSYFDLVIRLSNGWVLSSYSKRIDLYSKEDTSIRVYHDKNDYFLCFNPSDIKTKDNVLMLGHPEKATITAAWDAYETTCSDEVAEKMRNDFNDNVHVTSINFVKVSTSYVTKYDV